MNLIFSSKSTFSTRFTIFWANIFLTLFKILNMKCLIIGLLWFCLQPFASRNPLHFVFYPFKIFFLRSLGLFWFCLQPFPLKPTFCFKKSILYSTSLRSSLSAPWTWNVWLGPQSSWLSSPPHWSPVRWKNVKYKIAKNDNKCKKENLRQKMFLTRLNSASSWSRLLSSFERRDTAFANFCKIASQRQIKLQIIFCNQKVCIV